jgi:hypothetical protein
MSKEKEITIMKYDLAKPEQVKNMAIVLKDYINKNGLSVDIQGKKYCMCEGWQFAGFLTGIMPIVESVENLSTTQEIKWKVTVKLMKDDKNVGIGIALCSNKEGKKKSFDEYAILSMAQTRAIGKAYRNLMGWVIKLAGYESVPAEEMKSDNGKQDSYAIAVSMIEASKNESRVVEIGERIEKSKKFTAEQKKELEKMIGNKLNQLEKSKK